MLASLLLLNTVKEEALSLLNVLTLGHLKIPFKQFKKMLLGQVWHSPSITIRQSGGRKEGRKEGRKGWQSRGRRC